MLICWFKDERSFIKQLMKKHQLIVYAVCIKREMSLETARNAANWTFWVACLYFNHRERKHWKDLGKKLHWMELCEIWNQFVNHEVMLAFFLHHYLFWQTSKKCCFFFLNDAVIVRTSETAAVCVKICPVLTSRK